MARYAKVDVRIWDDERVKRLSPIQPSGQGLWIRLLVSRHRTSIPGLMCVGEAALAEEFGWTMKGFREGFQEVLAQGLAKADWEARLVWIPKAIKYNPPENPNVIKGWEVPWNEVPECRLKDEAYRALKEYVKGLSKGFQEAFEKGCPNRLAEPEPEPEDLPLPSGRGDDILKVFAHYRTLHPKACRDPKASSTEWKKIKARLCEGSTVEDLIQAIDGYHQHGWHVENNQLGLELIVRDASHVAQGIGYLEKPAQQPMFSARPSQPRDIRVGHVRAEDCIHGEVGEVKDF